jgi:hypothetical protein
VECQGDEFDSFKVGDIVSSKVLRKSEEDGRMWIELTRRKQHMDAQLLDNDLLALCQLDTCTEGMEV